MATVIRFARHGTKKKPYFRMVVQDQRSPRDGRFVEHIGAYDPIKGDASLTVKRDRLEYWLSIGAQLSDSVRTRLKPVMKQLQAAAPQPVVKDKPAKEPKAKKTAKAKTQAKEA
ncbi:MAG: 30S ribosomal protein S16 [Deltaproteobacteria bacterium]